MYVIHYTKCVARYVGPDFTVGRKNPLGVTSWQLIPVSQRSDSSATRKSIDRQ